MNVLVLFVFPKHLGACVMDQELMVLVTDQGTFMLGAVQTHALLSALH